MFRRVYLVIGALFLLMMVGTVGLRVIEGPEKASWLDSLYMAVISLTTVGYGETIPLSDGGKIFIIFYLLAGLGIFTYGITLIGQWVVSMELQSVWFRRQMQKQIAELENHYIVCGFGRMGATICEYLAEQQKSFVVVDHIEENLKAMCQEHHWLYVLGDATDDEVLQEAGIERAKSLSSVLPTDADNVYVALSARLLSSTVQIIARASEEAAVQKLERAGATRVVSPFRTGAMRMARFMLNPPIEDFLEITDSHGNLELADVLIDENSPYVGKKLRETDLREQGLMVIGIRRASGERLIPPPGSADLCAGDSLFVFGTPEGVNVLISGSKTVE